MTKEQAIDQGNVMIAWGNGAKLQYKGTGAIWTDVCGVPAWNFLGDPDVFYRIKPEPKSRPWKAHEIPFDAWFKSNVGTIYRLLSITSEGMIKFCGYEFDYTSPNLLSNSWSHSIDQGKTWQPCGVLES